MKYKTIGAFKNVQNVPYFKATADMKVGMGVILDRASKEISLPTSTDEAKSIHYIVTNINDRPEMLTSLDAFVVKEGEYVRADDLHTVNEMEIEFAAFEITNGTDGLAIGDILVFGEDGMLVKTDSTEGYTVYFTVLKRTTYMGDGIIAEVSARAVTPAGGSGSDATSDVVDVGEVDYMILRS